MDDGNGFDLALGERHASNILVLVLDSLLEPGLLRNLESVVDLTLGAAVFLSLLVDLLVDFDDVLCQLPVEAGLYLEVVVIDLISVACQTQILKGEVPLLVDVSIVVLRNLRPDIVVFSFGRLVLWFLSLYFVLNVNLALQACSDVGRHDQASGPLFIVVDVADGTWIDPWLIYPVESIGSAVRRQSSACEVEWLFNWVLTDI